MLLNAAVIKSMRVRIFGTFFWGVCFSGYICFCSCGDIQDSIPFPTPNQRCSDDIAREIPWHNVKITLPGPPARTLGTTFCYPQSLEISPLDHIPKVANMMAKEAGIRATRRQRASRRRANGQSQY